MMTKCLQASVVIASLLATTAPPTFAQTPPAKQEQPRRDRDEGLWGLLGLLGLVGLAGLRRRRRRDDYDIRRDNDVRGDRLP